LCDRKDRTAVKANQERGGGQRRDHRGEVGCQHHSANTGPARPDVTAGAHNFQGRRGGGRGHDEPADEFNKLLDQIDRLTDTAAQMLADEKDLN
jgi:hypothetical protein